MNDFAPNKYKIPFFSDFENVLSFFKRDVPMNRLFSNSHDFFNSGPRGTKITTWSVDTLLAVVARGFTVSCCKIHLGHPLLIVHNKLVSKIDLLNKCENYLFWPNIVLKTSKNDQVSAPDPNI